MDSDLACPGHLGPSHARRGFCQQRLAAPLEPRATAGPLPVRDARRRPEHARAGPVPGRRAAHALRLAGGQHAAQPRSAPRVCHWWLAQQCLIFQLDPTDRSPAGHRRSRGPAFGRGRVRRGVSHPIVAAPGESLSLSLPGDRAGRARRRRAGGHCVRAAGGPLASWLRRPTRAAHPASPQPRRPGEHRCGDHRAVGLARVRGTVAVGVGRAGVDRRRRHARQAGVRGQAAGPWRHWPC